jgi:hypothetical protein
MRMLYAVPFILVSGAALAQEAPLATVYACAGITEASARLACFDTAVATLRQAQTGGDLAIVSRAQIATAEREAFGLATPSLSTLAQSATTNTNTTTTTTTPPRAAVAPAEPLDSVTLALARIETAGDGKLRFITKSGQIWRQTDRIKLANLGKGPWSAEVKKAALGSFMLKIGEKPPVRVMRVE